MKYAVIYLIMVTFNFDTGDMLSSSVYELHDMTHRECIEIGVDAALEFTLELRKAYPNASTNIKCEPGLED